MLKEAVQVGEEVAEYTSRGVGSFSTSVQTVAKITPKGQIVLHNGNRYNKEGLGPDRDSYSNRNYITNLTPGLRSALERQENIKYLDRFNMRSLSAEAIAAIVEITKNPENKYK